MSLPVVDLRWLALLLALPGQLVVLPYPLCLRFVIFARAAWLEMSVVSGTRIESPFNFLSGDYFWI